MILFQHADIIVGGQYGSEAKGHVAAIIHQATGNDVCLRVGGPNAGHTVVDAHGQAFAFRTIPVAAVLDDTLLYLGPGSEIDMSVLLAEIQMCRDAGYDITDRLIISPQATVLEPKHIEWEQEKNMRGRIGSTAKGVGRARAQRLARKATIYGDYNPTPEEKHMLNGTRIGYPAQAETFTIEGTQGYGLGLHAGHYPFCTAGDCRAVDFLAQSGLPSRVSTSAWVVFRTFPIRVAGNSGPMNNETSWAELGRQTNGYITEERTTVTKLVRRVAAWDDNLAQEALEANGPDAKPVLTFVDYLDPSLAGCTSQAELEASPAWRWITNTEERLDAQFELFTTGPATHIWRNN